MGTELFDAISLKPIVVLVQDITGHRVGGSANRRLELLCQMSLGGHMGQQMGEIAEPGTLRADAAMKRNGRIASGHIAAAAAAAGDGGGSCHARSATGNV